LRNQNSQRRSLKTALLTAALTAVVTTGAWTAPSVAKAFSLPDAPNKSALKRSTMDDVSSFGTAYARGSKAHLRRANRIAHRGSGARLTYFYRGGKLNLVNTDHGGGLQGIASIYHDPITANGEHMNPNAMTAAHKSLPFGSLVTVHNKRNGRSATVRINDRGPYVTGRVIDLSPAAARVLGVDGLAPVSLKVGGRHVANAS
jgi:rare lipoprotein A